MSAKHIAENALFERYGHTSPFWALFAAIKKEDPQTTKLLLWARLALVNIVASALLGAAWFEGWITLLLLADTTHLVALISVVFVYGLVYSFFIGTQVSRELNAAKEKLPPTTSRAGAYLEQTTGRDGSSRAMLASALKLKLVSRITPIRHIANSLVFLGLIGTVVGFIIALSGIDPKSAADVSSIGPMVSTLIDGMSVALHTTLVGAVLNIWLMINFRLVEGGTVRLLTAIVERGEKE